MKMLAQGCLLGLVAWAVIICLVLIGVGVAHAGTHHHYTPANWIYSEETCTVDQGVSPTGSTAGAPTPLPDFQVVGCTYTPGHWRWQHPRPRKVG